MNEPAFPHWDGPSGTCFNGLTMRDYFAAKAMTGAVSWCSEDAFTSKLISVVAYEIADAMLAERAKHE